MTVYVVQEPMRRDRDTGDMVPLFDLTPAAEYGDLVFVFPPGRVSLSTQPMVWRARQALQGYCDEDFILPVGDPVAIGVVAACAADVNRGRLRFLKWDRRLRGYLSVSAETRNGGST